MVDFLENIQTLMNSRLHGNSLRSEILRIAKLYNVEKIQIIRTKRGYIIYIREKNEK